MTTDRVMLLIDADNVSVDVMEQAVARLLDEYGSLHVRRAYCTAESAVKHQAVFKRLSIKPMVNLAAGKNSTDIALAVDAIDLVLAERPEVVVIASSDSDFAPLVSRLREKGCKVRGFGQEGKTGDETRSVYDSFDVLAHRTRASAATRSTARGAARKTGSSRRPAAALAEAVVEALSAPVTGPAVAPADVNPAPAAKAPARKSATKRGTAAAKAAATKPASSRARKSTPKAARAAHAVVEAATEATTVEAPSDAALEALPEARLKALPKALPDVASGRAGAPVPAAVAELLRALPALAQGETLALQKAAEQLRQARLLSRSSSAQKLFSRFPDWFDLQPASDPRRVKARHPAP